MRIRRNRDATRSSDNKAWPPRHAGARLFVLKSGLKTLPNNPFVSRHHAYRQFEDLSSGHLDHTASIASEFIREFLENPKRLVGQIKGAFDSLFRDTSAHFLISVIRVGGTFTRHPGTQKQTAAKKQTPASTVGAGVIFLGAQQV